MIINDKKCSSKRIIGSIDILHDLWKNFLNIFGDEIFLKNLCLHEENFHLHLENFAIHF